MSLLAKHAAKTLTQAATTPVAPAPQPKAKPVAPAPQPKPEITVKTETTSRALSTFDPFAVITGESHDMANEVLAAIEASADAKPDFNGPFPIVELSRGNGGGKLVLGSNVTEEQAVSLPATTKPFDAVFLGYRLTYLAWPSGGQRGEGEAPAEKEKPLYSGVVNCADGETVSALHDAAEAYQFCGNKSKFDGIGHFRMGVEFLLFRKGQVFVLKLPTHFTSAQRALTALRKALPGGKLTACPLTLTPYTTVEPGRVQWQCHSIRIAIAQDLNNAPEWQAWQAARADILADEDMKANIAAWNTSDVTEAALAAMRQVASMGK